MTAIPYIILAFLGSPDADSVRGLYNPHGLSTCYWTDSNPHQRVCFPTFRHGNDITVVINRTEPRPVTRTHIPEIEQ